MPPGRAAIDARGAGGIEEAEKIRVVRAAVAVREAAVHEILRVEVLVHARLHIVLMRNSERGNLIIVA